MSFEFEINKNNFDNILRNLALELKKLKCKERIVLVLVGGAAIVANYSFRVSSGDIDGMYISSLIKEAANNMSDKYSFPNGWLNNDFEQTRSYSPNLYYYSNFYKDFLNILEVRTVSKEYLIAMKLVSFRSYKHDLQDIKGIIDEDSSIKLKDIKQAIINLYGSYDYISVEAKEYIETLLY